MVDVASSGMRLLVVDDDRLICWALKEELAGRDLSISLCHDGEEALGRVRSATYDLVILDVHLPDANGIAILEEIKRLSPGTRAIVISADAGAANIRRAVAAGAEQFIEKPFDPSMLGGRVLNMLRNYPVPRRHPRFACRIGMRMSLLAPFPPGAGFDGDTLRGIADEVGAGGMRVTTDHPLTAGLIVRVAVDAADSADPFIQFIAPRTTAEVRWATAEPSGFKAGLSFTKQPGRREA